MRILGVTASSILKVTSSYESIASATGTGSSGTITFSSIPSTYKHLQIRMIAKNTNTTALSADNVRVRFNSDSGSNYAAHRLYGEGTSAGALGSTGQTFIVIESASAYSHSSIPNTFGTAIIDIHDYSSTTKNKVLRSISGCNGNTSTIDFSIALSSGLWLSTNAITSIDVISQTNSFTSTSVFSLYGIKG